MGCAAPIRTGRDDGGHLSAICWAPEAPCGPPWTDLLVGALFKESQLSKSRAPPTASCILVHICKRDRSNWSRGSTLTSDGRERGNRFNGTVGLMLGAPLRVAHHAV